MAAYKELPFTIARSQNGLGCTIIGGTDNPDPSGNTDVILSDVHENGATAQAGLQVGDVILSVNGNDVTNASHDDVVELLRGSGKLEVIVRRSVQNAPAPPPTDEVRMIVDPSQRKKLAQEAFRSGDAELSRLAHAIPAEQHQMEQGKYLKPAVFGGLDGIITTFAVVASVAGANLDTGVILVLGFANLFADGISMAFGEYLSESSEQNHLRLERKREAWEFETAPESEVQEMVDVYKEKGFSEEDARAIITLMSNHKDFFIDHMMVQELGVMPVDEDENPIWGAIVIFVAFIIFGLIPLLSYLIFDQIDFNSDFDPLFLIACILTGLALFVLGAVKSKFSPDPWWKSGLWVFANGATAACVAFAAGYVLELIVEVDCAA